MSVRVLGELVVRAPRRVLAAALAFAVVAAAFGLATPRLLGRGSNDFVAHGSESLRAQRAVEAASGLSAAPQLLVLVRRPTPRRLARVAGVIRSEPTFPLVAAPLRSRDGGQALLAAYARAGSSQRVWREAAVRVDGRLAGVSGVAVGGTALAITQVNDQVQHDLTFAEELAFPLLFLLALWVFRSLVAALLPLLCGALTILGGLLVLRLVDVAMPVSTYALNIVTGIGLGLGIDYSLLLVSRYREELARLGAGPEAVRRTMATAGRTVAFSSVTIAAAIATLAVFPLGFLRSMGIAGGLVAPLAGLISLTVLPSLFVLLGERVNALSPRRWRRAAERAARGERGGWYRLAHALMRRPVPVAVAATALLVVLALPFLSVRFTGVDPSVLPPKLSSRVVDAALRSDFPPTAVSPVYAVVRGSEADARAYAAAVRAPLVLSPRRLGPGVWEVRATSGKPFLDGASQRLVRQMRALPRGALVGGSTAQFLDQKRALAAGLPLALSLLAAVTYLLLWAATRSLVLPLKALAMNMLTICATFGILVFVFQDGRLEGLLDYRSQGALELTVPVLLFVVAFGLATDYGVFLLTRIKEAWDAGLPNREAVAVGLERTGRIVTAAALLFCIAVGAFATSQIIIVKEVGIGISLAVLIDASIVRALLVPSLMAILGRWNWWPSTQPPRGRKARRLAPDTSSGLGTKPPAPLSRR
ncbi:MAG TPA: MMPL family transporter [Gaiellaceae bacterium]|nr:MMPL family transporter [Gaiellaceae bacterium]